MSLNVFYDCWLSLTVSTSAMKLLHIFHFHYQCYGVAAFLSLYPIVAGCLPLSLPVPWSCFLSLTVSHCRWLSLIVFTSAMEFLHVSHCLFQFYGVATCLSLSPMIAGCLYQCHEVAAFLSLSLPVP